MFLLLSEKCIIRCVLRINGQKILKINRSQNVLWHQVGLHLQRV